MSMSKNVKVSRNINKLYEHYHNFFLLINIEEQPTEKMKIEIIEKSIMFSLYPKR